MRASWAWCDNSRLCVSISLVKGTVILSVDIALAAAPEIPPLGCWIAALLEEKQRRQQIRGGRERQTVRAEGPTQQRRTDMQGRACSIAPGIVRLQDILGRDSRLCSDCTTSALYSSVFSFGSVTVRLSIQYCSIWHTELKGVTRGKRQRSQLGHCE